MKTVALLLVSAVCASAVAKDHPSLVYSVGDFDIVAEKAKTDACVRAVVGHAVLQAEKALGAKSVEYVLDASGVRLLKQSRLALGRIANLAFAWRVTKDARFAERARRELATVCAFKDWNPSHYLDTAEMALGVAIGYDWLYEVLDAGERAACERALLENLYATAFDAKRTQWFHKGDNNWNQVCHGALVAAGVALADVFPEESKRMIDDSLEHLPKVMRLSYSPGGCYPEGPGYWSYGTTYNVLAIAILEQASGKACELCGIEGFAETGAYLVHTTGTSGEMYDFSDCNPGPRQFSPAVWWFAQRFGHPEWTAGWQKNALLALARADGYGAPTVQRPAVVDCNWALPVLARFVADPGEGVRHELPSWNGRSSSAQICVLRRDGWYAAFRTGTVKASHAHMDVGSFVLDADGVRWAEDLGMETYATIEASEVGGKLWVMAQSSPRWRLFRLGPFSHNQVTVDGALQRLDGRGDVTAFSDDSSSPSCEIDLSSVFGEDCASSVKRRAAISGNGFDLEDSFCGLRSGASLRWAMMTKASVSFDGRIATLTRQGRTLRLEAPEGTAWRVREDFGLKPYERPTTGHRQIYFDTKAPDTGRVTITVSFRLDTGTKAEDAE